MEVDERPLMLVERVNSLRHLFLPRHDVIHLLHFFIKRMGYTQGEFYRLPIAERTKLYDLEQKVIDEENKHNK